MAIVGVAIPVAGEAVDRIVLDDTVAPGLYLVRSESDTVFVLRFRKPLDGWGIGASQVRRIRGRNSTTRLPFDGWWLPLVSVAPAGTPDHERWPSRIEVGSRPLWVHVADLRHWTMEAAWILQREVVSIERIGYEQMRQLAADRDLILPPWTPGQDRLIGGQE